MLKRFKKEILDLRKEGLTYNEIRSKLGCSTSTISYHCRKAGLSDSNEGRSPTQGEIDEMQRLYDETRSSRKVAQKVGWSKFTVCKYVTLKEKLTEEERKKKSSKAVVNWRKRTKIKLINYKGGSCIECGYDKCVDALTFHHLDPGEKDFNIGGKSWSFERLKNEVDKCILVCNRCHTEIHAGALDVEGLINIKLQ